MLRVLVFVAILCSHALCANDPTLWKNFLMNNRMKQCASRADEIPMPLSFFIPGGYFDGIPLNQRVDDSRKYTQPMLVPECNGKSVQPDLLNQFSFESERFLSTIGLNIYDGAVHSAALALLGETDAARAYEKSIIFPGQTCQFQDTRADKPCKGLIRTGACTDPTHSGACGFCYGSGTTMNKANAWTFRFLSDYWSLAGTLDARCPEFGHTWVWDDYKPVLGENSWSNLISPLQVAYMVYGQSAENIPVDDMAMTNALNFLDSLSSMVIPSLGALYYSPKNTIDFQDEDMGYTVSTENNVSLLAGLKMLRYILASKGILPDKIALIDTLIASITGYIRQAYSPSLGFFRTGGAVDPTTNQFSWYTGDNVFAVDCQTWTMSVIGPVTVDSWFGQGTAAGIWNTTKKMGGYHYSWTGRVDGLGFSNNSDSSVFSGEWSLGGINMLRVFSNLLKDKTYSDEATAMRANILKLTDKATINGVDCYGVNYANKRFWIPFGWFANPVLSTAATGWAVFLDSNWNPFYLGGGYGVDY